MRIIKPALDEGDVVITDRFFDSTSVYQGVVGGVEPAIIEALNTLCLNHVCPQVTILLDIDPEIGLQRSNRSENDETRFEDKGLEFHQNVREAYLDLAKKDQDRVMVIDASRNEKAIHDDIIAQLEPILRAAQ